jgi:hypothetical protein
MSYIKLNKDRVVYLDIDDSTILWEPEKYHHTPDEIVEITDGPRKFPFLPHKRNIEFVQKLKLQGYGVVVWSAAGASWAEHVIKMLGLEDLPDMIISKPELCVDDLLEANRIIKSIVWIHPDSGEFKRNA